MLARVGGNKLLWAHSQVTKYVAKLEYGGADPLSSTVIASFLKLLPGTLKTAPLIFTLSG